MRYAESLFRVLILLPALGIVGCAVHPVSGKAPSPSTVKTLPAAPKVEAPVRPELRQAWQQALGHMRAGRDRDAEQGFLALTRRAPELSGPYANLGLLYQRAGRMKEAIVALERAIEINPERAVYYNALGILYRQEGKFDMAEKNYRRALDHDPGLAAAHLNLAILNELYRNEPKDALAHYQRYRELVPAERATLDKWIIDLERRLGVKSSLEKN